MVTGSDMGHDHDMLEREAGAALGYPHRIQSAVDVKHARDRGG